MDCVILCAAGGLALTLEHAGGCLDVLRPSSGCLWLQQARPDVSRLLQSALL